MVPDLESLVADTGSTSAARCRGSSCFGHVFLTSSDGVWFLDPIEGVLTREFDDPASVQAAPAVAGLPAGAAGYCSGMATDVLTAGEAEELHRLLVAERARLGRRAAWLEITFQELVDAADLEPPDDEHDPDGTTAYERAQVGSLERESRSRIDQVVEALARLDADDYGTCERCGGAIGFARLVAVLGTQRCVDCSRR